MGQVSPEDIKRQIAALQKRRDDAAQKIERVKGRLEESERVLADLKAECRSKGLDPDQLDVSITKLQGALEDSIRKYDESISHVEMGLSNLQKSIDNK